MTIMTDHYDFCKFEPSTFRNF